ncbi:MAG: glycosyltransferase [Burkholderiaceae bacterium]|nr:glycosyltransferase [Rhodoferax sp.]MCP5285820.1 glycosyltransferase [Burkholderiaceae bacterium]
MKLLQVSKFYPPELGGIEAVARDLSAGLMARGVDVEVLCAHTRWRREQAVGPAGERVTRAASAGLWLSTSMAPGLVTELRRRQEAADIIHVHMPDPLAALAVWAARPRGRVVLHWHSDVVRQRLAMHVYRPLERWLLARADAVVATSAAYAESSVPLAPWQHKVTVVPIGAPPPEAPPAARVQRLRQLADGRRIVFSLGRMTHYKGWDVLIEAARSLPDDVLVLVGGGGPDLAHYRAMAVQAGVAGKIVFRGAMASADVEAAFAEAAVFCLASTVRAEAYGVAVLEAMARGLPVVATDIPGSGLGWLVQHGSTGLKVPVRDPAALAAGVRQLLEDAPLRQRCGDAGRARWASAFTVDAMCRRMLALYDHLLADRPGVPQAPVVEPSAR